jgi:catechol 2,3-dioxygenase-like lactoylglutathione lyase family enzyme
MKRILSSFFALLVAIALHAQSAPGILGLAGLTFRVSSFGMAESYYGKLLGFPEAFRYESDEGPVRAFKVNDRQFIQVVESAGVTPGGALVKVSILVESASAIHDFLSSRGWTVTPVSTDGAGEKVFSCRDADGNPVEFVEYQSGGKHLRCAGRKLSKKRISDRIAHAGLPSAQVDSSDPFWVGVLGCREILRVDKGGRSIHYLRLGQSLESIEHYSPSGPDFAHPCLQTMDMQATVDLLRARGGTAALGAPGIGLTRRWIYNALNPDGVRVEFTEPFCVK